MNLKKVLFITSSLISIPVMAELGTLRECEKLWEYKTKDKKNLDEFANWWGNEGATSRVLARLHIIHKDYKSMLDVGCGFCTDFDALRRSIPGLEYKAIDISSNFVAAAVAKGICAEVARVQQIPYADCSIELVYARHLLEHLDAYEQALQEMVRVAGKEVMIVFFIAPDQNSYDKPGMINIGGYATYQNKYSRSKMESFLKSLPKVKSFSWQDLKNTNECIVHIIVADNAQ
jgi:ubiquinone/menaquinone biosynthesis C-methylase UbiE